MCIPVGFEGFHAALQTISGYQDSRRGCDCQHTQRMKKALRAQKKESSRLRLGFRLVGFRLLRAVTNRQERNCSRGIAERIGFRSCKSAWRPFEVFLTHGWRLARQVIHGANLVTPASVATPSQAIELDRPHLLVGVPVPSLLLPASEMPARTRSTLFVGRLENDKHCHSA